MAETKSGSTTTTEDTIPANLLFASVFRGLTSDDLLFSGSISIARTHPVVLLAFVDHL